MKSVNTLNKAPSNSRFLFKLLISLTFCSASSLFTTSTRAANSFESSQGLLSTELRWGLPWGLEHMKFLTRSRIGPLLQIEAYAQAAIQKQASFFGSSFAFLGPALSFPLEQNLRAQLKALLFWQESGQLGGAYGVGFTWSLDPMKLVLSAVSGPRVEESSFLYLQHEWLWRSHFFGESRSLQATVGLGFTHAFVRGEAPHHDVFFSTGLEF